MAAKTDRISPMEHRGEPLPEKLDPKVVGIKDGRVPAPAVSIESPHYDERYEQVARLDEADPAYVHVYQPGGITPEQLAAKRMEVVMDGNGEPLRHRGDIVCRTDRKAFEAPLRRESLMSRKQMKEVQGVDRTQIASPKAPMVQGEDALDEELAQL